jgi:hypothetical protein
MTTTTRTVDQLIHELETYKGPTDASQFWCFDKMLAGGSTLKGNKDIYAAFSRLSARAEGAVIHYGPMPAPAPVDYNGLMLLASVALDGSVGRPYDGMTRALATALRAGQRHLKL